MARPHIEFIQSQVLPFSKGLYGGSRPEVDMRILSIDEEHGDASTMIRWPKGWKRAEPEYLDCDEEFLVLEGSIKINDNLYKKHDYAHLPKGYLRNTQSSSTGAVTISFFSSEPHSIISDKPGNGFDSKRLVEHIETRTHETMPHESVGESFDTPDWDPTGTFHKLLYQDPYSGERTWMIGMAPHWQTDLCEVHPVVEEEFSILGDLCFPVGVFRDGAYFWRPPGIQHGPFSSWGGSLHLVRCKGGPFATEWVNGDPPDWFPEYNPTLPPEYKKFVDEDKNYNREPNY
ncbi:MAG: DUF4437 domain-containing protein [Pseudomonadota bacterium]|nr:DUF4437 domain-containing protein [Pseudomonadota bacterium]